MHVSLLWLVESSLLSDEDSKQQDVEDDDDGPPPGWEFFSMANALPKPPSNSAGHFPSFSFFVKGF